MATFKQEFKENVQENIRDLFESRTGIIGEALRNRRERQEREKEIKEEVEHINVGTTRLKSTGATLASLETSFIQISRNLQLIAKHLKAQVTTQEETNQSIDEQRKLEPAKQKQLATKIEEKDDSSLFDRIMDLLDGFGRGRKKPPKKSKKPRGKKGRRGGRGRGPTRPGRTPTRVPPSPQRPPVPSGPTRVPPEPAKPPTPQPNKAPTPVPDSKPPAGSQPNRQPPTPKPRPTVSKGAIKSRAMKRMGLLLAKMGIKSIPIIGAGIGVGFAIARLLKGDPVGAGLEATGALGSAMTAIPASILQEARDLYYEFYGVYPENDPAPDAKERWDVLYEAVKEAANDSLRELAAPRPEINLDSGYDVMGNPTGYIPAPEAPPTPPPPKRAPPPSPPPSPPARPAPAPSGGGAPQPAPVGKPGAAGTLPPAAPTDQKGNAGRLAAVLHKYGITNPYAKTAIISTAAKESGLNPASKELGAGPWLKTIDSKGVEYVWKALPQLGPNGRVANRLGYPQGMSADVLRSYFSKGDESFFELVYGMIPKFNPNPGDGYKYRGRGFVQITGRAVYSGVSKEIGIDLESDPDKILTDFDTASAALAGYIFRTRGGKDKALKELNSMTDINSALRYVLHSVAGLGKDARQFDVAESNMRHQLEKASTFVGLAAGASGADVGNYSITPAMYAKGTSFNGPTTVVVVKADEKKAAPVQVAQPRTERPAQIG